MQTINIARDFSATPAGRFRTDGRFSGQIFREDILLPKLQRGPVSVELDGVAGFGSSFLEEAFGGLVRKHGFDATELRTRLKIVAIAPRYQRYRVNVWEYIDEAMTEKTGAKK